MSGRFPIRFHRQNYLFRLARAPRRVEANARTGRQGALGVRTSMAGRDRRRGCGKLSRFVDVKPAGRFPRRRPRVRGQRRASERRRQDAPSTCSDSSSQASSAAISARSTSTRFCARSTTLAELLAAPARLGERLVDAPQQVLEAVHLLLERRRSPCATARGRAARGGVAPKPRAGSGSFLRLSFGAVLPSTKRL